MLKPTNLEADEAKTIDLAMGRIFRMMSRPTQPGDVAEYERCRSIILNMVGDVPTSYVPNWAAQRLSGAAGD